MARTVYTYIGAGQVFLERLDQQNGLLPIADASELQLSIETSEVTQKQHTQVGGGNLDKINRVDSLSLTLALGELKTTELAMALYGDASVVAAAAVTGESHVVRAGALVMFDNPPDTTVDYVVKNQDGTITYDVGTDYTVTSLGIFAVDGGGIAEGGTVQVEYTKQAGDAIQMLVNSGYEYRLVFEGLNEANGGIAQPVVLHRCKFSPASGLGLITEEFGNLSLEGEALIDVTKVGSGLSRYGTIWNPQ